MVVVPVGKKYILLDKKNISARTENILNIQNYIRSMIEDSLKCIIMQWNMERI